MTYESADPIAEYAEEAVDACAESSRLAGVYASKERRLNLLTIVMTFLAAGLGVVVTFTGWATLAIVPGILSAGVGAIASWGKAAQWGMLAEANRRLSRGLDRELTALRYRTDPYVQPDVGERGRLFVARCEAMMDEVHEQTFSSSG